MKDYSQEKQEGFDENILAELNIYVTKDNQITFGCNWEPSEEGIESISSIFFRLAYDDLSTQILKQLKTQCVLEENHEDFSRIIDTIQSFITQDKNGIYDESEDSLVIPPRNVPRL
tara:strand:- start:1751 stop:2098 length:348 start_codon:yes stop_codon:yes gene_type:complete